MSLNAVNSELGGETMSKSLQAIYENGVLRLLEPLGLREQHLVTVTLTAASAGVAEDSLLDEEFLADCDTLADEAVSLATVRQALAKIPGSLTDDLRAERDER
jgi:predicted DNA-binding antitoxin AbrB/MazE fold protein